MYLLCVYGHQHMYTCICAGVIVKATLMMILSRKKRGEQIIYVKHRQIQFFFEMEENRKSQCKCRHDLARVVVITVIQTCLLIITFSRGHCIRRLAFARIGISFAQIFSFICAKKKHFICAKNLPFICAKNLPFICANYFYDCVPLPLANVKQVLTLLPLAHHGEVEVGF